MDTWHKSYERYDVITPPALPAPNSSSKFASMAHAIQQQDSQVALNIENRYNWHTPTELFHPYYGEALARYILVNYKLNVYPYNDLISMKWAVVTGL